MRKVKYNRHDRSFDVKDMVSAIRTNWLIIVVCGLVCAAFLIVGMQRSEYKSAAAAAQESVGTDVSAIYNGLTDGEKSTIQLARSQEEQLNAQNDYISNSVFMNIDPYKEGNTTLYYNITYLTTVDATIIGRYIDYAGSNAFYEAVVQKMSTEMEVQYVKELITCTQNTVDMNRYYTEFYIKVIADSQELCEDIADAVDNVMQAYISENQGETAGYTIDTVDSGYSEMVDTELYNKQYVSTSNYYNLQSMYNATIATFTDNMKLVYAATDEELAGTAQGDTTSSEVYAPYRVKYVVLGALIGIFLAVLGIILAYLLSNKVKTEADLESIYDLNVFGTGTELPLVAANMNNVCSKRGINSVVLCGTISESNKSIMNKLIDEMQKKGIELTIAGDIGKDVEAREMLASCEHVVFVSQNKKTTYPEVESWLKLCRDLGISVLGAVALD